MPNCLLYFPFSHLPSFTFSAQIISDVKTTLSTLSTLSHLTDLLVSVFIYDQLLGIGGKHSSMEKSLYLEKRLNPTVLFFFSK